MPPLTDQWATAYVQILLTIIIFAIGIPALAMEIIAQEEVRHVAHNRMRVTAFTVVVILVSLLAFYAFVWVLHPPFDLQQKTPAPAPADDGSTWMYSMWASVIVTVVPIIAIVFGMIQVSAFTRKKLIGQLEAELAYGVGDGRKSWRRRLAGLLLWKRGKPHILRDETLNDLIYLGEHGKPGNDKRLVLRALGRVAEKAQNSPRYKDGELEELIKGLRTVVVNRDRRGEDGDFILAAKVLKDIRARLAEPSDVPKHNDMLRARTVFEELFVEAVKHRAEATVKGLLSDASSKDIDIIFKVGLEALHTKHYEIATASLAKLEAVAEEAKLKCGDETSNLLGLLAQFIASQSVSAQRRAAMYLRAFGDSFSPSLAECVRAARKHHFSGTNYDTADRLDELLVRMERENWLAALPEDEE